ncbi:MAG: alpha/beta fold hydrolase [Gaiellales bacterium]
MHSVQYLSPTGGDTFGERGRWGGLAGTLYGDPPSAGRPLLLLHGLTFDHRMWEPVAAAQPDDQPALALDLPGHGSSPALARHHMREVVAVVHKAVDEAGLERPIIVGHSISGIVATMYAATHPVAAVVNVDCPMFPPEGYLRIARAIAPRLRGDRFHRAWSLFRNSMRIDRVPQPQRSHLAAAYDVSPEQVLSYWAELLDGDPDQTVAWICDQTELMLSRVRRDSIPYVSVAGDSVDVEDREWFEERVPHGRLLAWPVGHHFPHLADPARFVALLTGLAAALPDRRAA